MISKKTSIIITLIVLITAGIVSGTILTQQSKNIDDPDTRVILKLPNDERHLVLTEMRNFVIAMQMMMEGLSEEDMSKVAKEARKMGSAAADTVPPSVVAKLPDTFKQLAGKVHTTFDAIAMDAESLGDPGQTVSQIAELTQYCVACHAIYQVDRE